MGCKVSRLEAEDAADGGGGAAQRTNRRTSEVGKGKEDEGQARGRESRRNVESEGEDEKEQNEREDYIWSPGAPSFREYCFIGSFDSNDSKGPVGNACQIDHKPHELHNEKGSQGQTRWACGIGGFRTGKSKTLPTTVL